MPSESFCDRCGHPASGIAGDEALCESCYQVAGSCCGEFGTKETDEPGTAVCQMTSLFPGAA